jgi:hypothetical protein
MTRRILLISSFTCHPTGYLDHAEPEIRDKRAAGGILAGQSARLPDQSEIIRRISPDA